MPLGELPRARLRTPDLAENEVAASSAVLAQHLVLLAERATHDLVRATIAMRHLIFLFQNRGLTEMPMFSQLAAIEIRSSEAKVVKEVNEA